jgi:hypothetical protein
VAAADQPRKVDFDAVHPTVKSALGPTNVAMLCVDGQASRAFSYCGPDDWSVAVSHAEGSVEHLQAEIEHAIEKLNADKSNDTALMDYALLALDAFGKECVEVVRRAKQSGADGCARMVELFEERQAKLPLRNQAVYAALGAKVFASYFENIVTAAVALLDWYVFERPVARDQERDRSETSDEGKSGSEQALGGQAKSQPDGPYPPYWVRLNGEDLRVGDGRGTLSWKLLVYFWQRQTAKYDELQGAESVWPDPISDGTVSTAVSRFNNEVPKQLPWRLKTGNRCVFKVYKESPENLSM